MIDNIRKGKKIILHCDMDNFYASVELLEKPELAGKPVAISGNPEGRHGIILAKNQVAKGYSIKTGENLWQARKKCPHLICLKPHMYKYKKYSQLVNQIYMGFTDMIEPFSIDESWLDVTASQSLFGSGLDMADAIRKKVREDLGLTVSVGVSFNKVFAKMGSDFNKPDGTTLIDDGNFKDVIWPLPVSQMFFVGAASSKKLNSLGIYTIEDLAITRKERLISLLGKQGAMIHDYANGLGSDAVSRFNEIEKIKSIGNSMTFSRDLITDDDISVAVVGLSDKVGGRLRRHQMKAYGVKIDIKDTRFKVISRQTQLDFPTDSSDIIRNTAINLIKKNWSVGVPIRLLSVTCINLCYEEQDEQLSIYSQLKDTKDQNKKNESLDKVVDNIREKYGMASISSCRIIGNDIGIDLDHNADE